MGRPFFFGWKNKTRYLLTTCAMAALTAVLGGFTCGATTIPKSGTFDIVVPVGISFDPIPWESDSAGEIVYLYPYATSDYNQGYSGTGAGYNLVQAQFCDGNINITDADTVSGDLGIRVANYSGQSRTFEACVMTLNFSTTSFNIYMPKFSFESMYNIYFWVASSGATYYAHTSRAAGYLTQCGPNMSAADAIAAGDEYLAAVPEPTTVCLLGLGALVLLRKPPTRKTKLRHSSKGERRDSNPRPLDPQSSALTD